MSIMLSIIMMKLMVADTAMCVCVRVCVCVEDGDDHHHDDSVTSCSSKFVGELNHTKLNMYIERLIGDVQQAKDLFRYLNPYLNPKDAANALFRYKGVMCVCVCVCVCV